MNELDRTTRYRHESKQLSAQILTIFDGQRPPYSINLSEAGKTILTFGRNPANDIVLHSPIVSQRHGAFSFAGGTWRIEDLGSKNGLLCNNTPIVSRTVSDGDLIRIDDGVETIADGVLFLFFSQESANEWHSIPLGSGDVTIGRSRDNRITLPHISVSKHHARISREGNVWYLCDENSFNGIILNGMPVTGKVRLHEKDIITITNSRLIFTSQNIYYCYYKSGISVDTSDVVIRRGKGRRAFITCDHVDVNIQPGELVAIIGGSGAGKSTILNCMCGYLKPNQGSVHINGIDLYRNFGSLKKIIGYVPQSDIVYDNLSLRDMLLYTAKLRLPKDVSTEERDAAIQRAIAMVELTEKANSLIRNLSGGQRKRASIAVELLSDPNLLFLDEPASGLDPGTERNLMHSLRDMADSGKTVILVTHSTLQLKLCDKILFMGKGGRLCFFGSHDEALKFFGVTDVVDIYNMITEDAPMWRDKFASRNTPRSAAPTEDVSSRSRDSKLRQLGVLCARYAKLVFNDRQRLMLLLLQAPALAFLISLVANDQQFEQYEITKSLLFALSCSAFWIGMLNAIQEICKETTIVKREYMTGLSLSSYITSKILVLGTLCLIQSLLVTGVFTALVGMCEEGILIHPYLEVLITTFLTAISSAAMGLFVSSFFSNADRAMTVAPLLLMPQILFSGLIFKLDGATEMISWFAVCRWSMEGYGTTANLNDLPLRLQQEGVMIPHEAETFYEFTGEHILIAWGIIAAFTLGFLILARLSLGRNIKKRS